MRRIDESGTNEVWEHAFRLMLDELRGLDEKLSAEPDQVAGKGTRTKLRAARERVHVAELLSELLTDFGAAVYDSMRNLDEDALHKIIEALKPEASAHAPKRSSIVTVSRESRDEQPRKGSSIQTIYREKAKAVVADPAEEPASARIVNAAVASAKLREAFANPTDDAPVKATAVESAERRRQTIRNAIRIVRDARTGDTEDASAIADELRGLELLQPDIQKQWGELPQEWNRKLTSLITCALRHVQERDRCHILDRRMRDYFRVLNDHSSLTWPGMVNGLSLKHCPEGDTWLDDAKAWEHELEAIAATDDTLGADEFNKDRALFTIQEALDANALEEAAHRLTQYEQAGGAISDPRFVNLVVRAAGQTGDSRVRELHNQVARFIDMDDDESGDETITDEEFRAWRFASTTEGRRIFIVGGDRRRRAEERIEANFRAKHVTWVPCDKRSPRIIQNLAHKLRNGSADLVIVLIHLAGHPAYKELKRSAGDHVHLVHSESYGVVGIQQAIERDLADLVT